MKHTAKDDGAIPTPTPDEFPDYTARAKRMNDLFEAPAVPLTEFNIAIDLPNSTMDALRAQGKGPRVFRLGRRLYVERDDGRAWIKKMAAAEGNPPTDPSSSARPKTAKRRQQHAAEDREATMTTTKRRARRRGW